MAEPSILFERKITLGNVLMMLVMVGGGVGFLIANEGRLSGMEMKVSNVERLVGTVEEKLRESGRTVAMTDERNNTKIEALARELSDVKISLRGIETSVGFLVQRERARERHKSD